MSVKIVGFTQLHNELRKGNLEGWFKSMAGCDFIYIYDQASTDGSREYYRRFNNAIVIESPINDFENEQICKAKMLERIYNEHPDFDWIFWLDGDTWLDGRLSNNDCKGFRDLVTSTPHEIGGIRFDHYNLWRSDVYYRVDAQYHDINAIGRLALWRNYGANLKITRGKGLHQPGEAEGIINPTRCNYCLIHRGFATDDQIIERYDIYKDRGQRGWDLDRLLFEDTLAVARLPQEVIPDWYEIKDTIHPREKKRIAEVYKERKDSFEG